MIPQTHAATRTPAWPRGGGGLPETGLAALSRPIAIAAHGMWPISGSMARVDRTAREKKLAERLGCGRPGVPVNGLQSRLGERNSKLILMCLMGSRHRPLRGRRITAGWRQHAPQLARVKVGGIAIATAA